MTGSGLPQGIAETPIQRMLRSFGRFVHMEAAGGIVLLVFAVAALVWANSPWASGYHEIWTIPLRVGFGGWEAEMTLHHFINDGLMVVFFFQVGLEIKREMLVGELASFGSAVLPMVAALGGMVVPAAIYALVNAGGEGEVGWGIPMATDIAFALGILALVGRRAPASLKIFLAALAIVDDLGAVLVIAVFYTADLALPALAVAGIVLVALVSMNRLGVRLPAAYAAGGFVLWAAVFASGVHATVAGVLLALIIPARTRIDPVSVLLNGRWTLDEFDRQGVDGHSVLSNKGQQAALQVLEEICEAGQSPLQRIENGLHLWVAFGIIPLFALANAGVSLRGDFGDSLANPVTLGVILGLVLGKPIGIAFFSWLTVRSHAAALPEGVAWRALLGVSFLGGIGFTMSLFIASLAFGEGAALLDSAKIGIVAASCVAAVVGWILLREAPPAAKV